MKPLHGPQAMVWLRMRWSMPKGVTWQRLLLGTLGPLVAVGLMGQVGGSAWRAAGFAFGGGLVAYLLCWPFQHLWTQNKPNWARLVPGHRRALQRASLLAAAAAWLPLALAHQLLWGLSPARMLLLVAGLVLMLWVLRRPRVLWPLVLLPPVVIALASQLFQLAPDLEALLGPVLEFLAGPFGLLLGTCLCLWGLWRWVGNGDAAHRQDHAALLLARRSAQRGWIPGGGWGDQVLSLLASWSTWPREWHFQRVLRASPVARIDHLLSRSAHWSVQLWAALQAGLLLGALLWWAQGATKLNILHLGDSLIALWIGVLSLAFSADVTRFQSLRRQQREQALLALLPGLSPAPGVLTRALARRWLMRGLLAWSLVLLLMGLALPYCKPETQSTMGAALAGCLLLVPLCSLFDPARLAPQPRGLDVLAQGGVLMVCIAAWPLAQWGWPFGVAPLLAALLVLPWVWRRWRGLGLASRPFPVGRLA